MGYLFDGVWKGMVWYGMYIYIYTYIHIYIYTYIRIYIYTYILWLVSQWQPVAEPFTNASSTKRIGQSLFYHARPRSSVWMLGWAMLFPSSGELCQTKLQMSFTSYAVHGNANGSSTKTLPPAQGLPQPICVCGMNWLCPEGMAVHWKAVFDWKDLGTPLDICTIHTPKTSTSCLFCFGCTWLQPLHPAASWSSILENGMFIMEFVGSQFQRLTQESGLHHFGQGVCQLCTAVNPPERYAFTEEILYGSCQQLCSVLLATWWCCTSYKIIKWFTISNCNWGFYGFKCGSCDCSWEVIQSFFWTFPIEIWIK